MKAVLTTSPQVREFLRENISERDSLTKNQDLEAYICWTEVENKNKK